jgi:hypothetical protein
MSKLTVGVGIVACGLVACGRTTTESAGVADASISPATRVAVPIAPIVTAHAAHPALTIARSFSPFSRLGEGLSVARGSDGWHLTSTQSASRSATVHVVGGDLDVTVPTRADGAVRVARAGSSRDWLTLRALDLASVEATPSEGALVFQGAAVDSDVVHAIEPQRFEDVRVVRSAAASTTLRYALTLGPDLASLRVRGHVVEALDRLGNVRLATEPLFAIDANGVREDVAANVLGRTLTLTLASGVTRAYPAVIDPSWYAPVAVVNGTQGAQDFLEVSPALPDGRYLVPILTSGAVTAYDPGTDSFTSAPALPYGPSQNYTDFTSTVLANGTVLMTGGNAPGGVTATAWIYDGKNAPVATANNMSVVRTDHTATLLSDGRVLIVGGGSIHSGATPSTSVDIFDPGTGKFAPVASTLQPHAAHTATLLNDGRVLVALGWQGGGVTSVVEIYDVTTNVWTQLPSLKTARYLHSAVKFPDGRVGIFGGASNYGTTYTDLDIFNPTSGTVGAFTSGAALPNARSGHLGVLDNVGHVVLAGGVSDTTGSTVYLASTDVYDPVANTWSTGIAMPHSRDGGYYAVMAGARTLWVGGLNGGSYATDAFIYQPDAITVAGSCPAGTTFVDGVCCNAPCTGVCEACNTAGRVGACWPLSGSAPLPGHGTGSDCGLYVCSAGACASSCLGDSACVLGNYCDVTSTDPTPPFHTCVPQKANGSGCAANDECVNGNCVDGFCCNSACTGDCQACDATGSVGTCTTIQGPQHGTRTDCSPYACSALSSVNAGKCVAVNSCAADTDCVTGFTCDPTAHACVAKLAIGATCSASNVCVSGFCVDGYCANSACASPCEAADLTGYVGTCHEVPNGTSPHGTRTCSPYLNCGPAACATSCVSDGDCVATFHCTGGVCVGSKANGVACAANSECTSNVCADGYCCATACAGACESCGLAGTLGACTQVSGALDPHGICAVGACNEICQAGACAAQPASIACGGVGSCTGHTFTGAGHCSGTDTTCVAAASTPCAGGLVCANATSCLQQCAADADCVTGHCDLANNLCGAPPIEAGIPDASVADTTVPDAGVDLGAPESSPVDVGVADLGVAQVPAPMLAATPIVGSFQRCSKNSDCTTGFCVEGVCCNTACTDKCFSCALLSNPGICTAEPIGVDLKNDCGASDQCLGTCGPGAQCIGSGTGTMCARNVCNGPSTGLGPAYCAGPGAVCNAANVAAFDCGPYACEPAFGACRNDCVTSSDCAQGYVCDTGSQTCVTAPTSSGSSGGCAIEARTSRASNGAFLAFAIAGLALTRRRR